MSRVSVPAHIRELRRRARRSDAATVKVEVPCSREHATWGCRGLAEPPRYYVTCAVTPDSVLVWDDVAGAYTVCHSLPGELAAKARQLAAARVRG